MNRKDLFELLGAPLNNYQWSWGAVRQEDGAVFLCAWEDEVRVHEGREIVPIAKHTSTDRRHGKLERNEHVRRIEAGADCYIIMCTAEDVNAKPRRIITDFNSPNLFHGSQLIELEG